MTGDIHARYVTLAYGGGAAVYRQASMLLVSLLAYAPPPRELVVVTDNPSHFSWLAGAARVHAVTAAQVSAWQGPQPFSMRVKLEVARAMAPTDGALILLDADTLAVADLAQMIAALARRSLFMHTREFELAGSRRRGNRTLWHELRGRRFGGWRFLPNDAMWNSGIIALNAADVTLMGEALQLYDAMGKAGIRYFATEQLVIGVVFGRTGRLREAARWFVHYWGNKAQFDREIARRLGAVSSGGLSPEAAAEHLRSDPFDLPAERRLGKIGKLRRWLARR